MLVALNRHLNCNHAQTFHTLPTSMLQIYAEIKVENVTLIIFTSPYLMLMSITKLIEITMRNA